MIDVTSPLRSPIQRQAQPKHFGHTYPYLFYIWGITLGQTLTDTPELRLKKKRFTCFNYLIDDSFDILGSAAMVHDAGSQGKMTVDCGVGNVHSAGELYLGHDLHVQ